MITTDTVIRRVSRGGGPGPRKIEKQKKKKKKRLRFWAPPPPYEFLDTHLVINILYTGPAEVGD